MQGDGDGDLLGYSVSTAGDVNGDGFDDLIVGAPDWDNADGNNAGRSYIILGGDTGFGVNVSGRQGIDVSNLSDTQGFIIEGDTAPDVLGRAVSSAGDVNNDGYDDLIVGAIGGDDGGNGAQAIGNSTTAVGGEAMAMGPGASAYGWRAVASAERATALGHLAMATGIRSVAVGEAVAVASTSSVISSVTSSVISSVTSSVTSSIKLSLSLTPKLPLRVTIATATRRSYLEAGANAKRLW